MATPALVPPARRDQSLLRWQRRLLPFVISFVIVLAVAFFGLGVYDLNQVRGFVETEHTSDIRTQVRDQLARSASPATSDDTIRNALVLLEADALDRRYHQASALLMSRVWTRHLAFMTGMVMAFLGATFILGKMSESQTDLSGGAAEWKVQISTASPGIMLCVLGTLLMMMALAVQTPIEIHDNPIYVGSGTGAQPLQTGQIPPPADIVDSPEDPLKTKSGK